MAGHDSSVMAFEPGPVHDVGAMQDVVQAASQRGAPQLVSQAAGALSCWAAASGGATEPSSLAKDLKALDAKQDQLRTLLTRTRTLFFELQQQSKINPSSEVPPTSPLPTDAHHTLRLRPTLTLLHCRWRG
jgi:hypothetical protein